MQAPRALAAGRQTKSHLLTSTLEALVRMGNLGKFRLFSFSTSLRVRPEALLKIERKAREFCIVIIFEIILHSGKEETIFFWAKPLYSSLTS